MLNIVLELGTSLIVRARHVSAAICFSSPARRARKDHHTKWRFASADVPVVIATAVVIPAAIAVTPSATVCAVRFMAVAAVSSRVPGMVNPSPADVGVTIVDPAVCIDLVLASAKPSGPPRSLGVRESCSTSE